MDIYDVLQRLVEARPFQWHEQQESLEIIAELRRLNAFGTSAGQVREEHQHDWVNQAGWRGTGRRRCVVCSLEEPWQA